MRSCVSILVCWIILLIYSQPLFVANFVNDAKDEYNFTTSEGESAIK